MIVDARYTLPKEARAELHTRPVEWGFGSLSEAVYFRTYSRTTEAGQEKWADTVIRVVEGAMSIRKDWLINVMGKRQNHQAADRIALELVDAIFDMKLLPPGRGLWAMGTEYIFERGSHALNNCGAVDVTTSLADSAAWLTDSLMCGVGVGFTTHNAKLSFKRPAGDSVEYAIPDSREGWVESVRRLIQSYEGVRLGRRPLKFDYSKIRADGEPIRGFGGTSAGPEPLVLLHKRLRKFLNSAAAGKVVQTRTIADVMNAIGSCVVAGNVRRSAEIAVGSPYDETFLDLKNYEANPERRDIGWMSNNSVALRERDDFLELPVIADRIRDNGEPGILNFMNVTKYGRLGEKSYDGAVAINPCGEIPLESFELCNLVEVFPTRCEVKELPRIFQLATFYASTVALLRSHSEETNEVVARNRRIGVSVSGIADWIDMTSFAHVVHQLNQGYDVVRTANRKLAQDAGVTPSIRVTTVKPSGTVSLLAGVSSGMHHPLSPYVLRRVRVDAESPVAEMLTAGGVPWEPDAVSDHTSVFEFPLRYGQGRTRSVKNVSVFEQAGIVAMLQRIWADNAVSNTLTFQPDESRHLEAVLSLFAGQIKSMSLLPDREGVYAQMPVERISRTDFEDRSNKLKAIDWSSLHGSDGDASSEAYCVGDYCEVPQ